MDSNAIEEIAIIDAIVVIFPFIAPEAEAAQDSRC